MGLVTLTMREALSLVWAITPLAYMGLRGILTARRRITPLITIMMMELELMDHIFGVYHRFYL